MDGQREVIETDNAGNASSPQIAMDSSGNAIAVWHQDDGTRNNIGRIGLTEIFQTSRLLKNPIPSHCERSEAILGLMKS